MSAEVFAGGTVGSILGQLVGVGLLQVARARLLATRKARAPEVSGTATEAVRGRLTARLFQLGQGARTSGQRGRHPSAYS
ncbi:MAG: hypothetical protein ACRDRK_03695 [Pseudonocardia sp.]